MDTQTPTAPPVLDQGAIRALAQDAVDTAALGKRIVAAYRAGGPGAASALLSDAMAAAQKDYQDVKAALPSIKAGYKSTEFWLTFTIVLGNGLYLLITHKSLPVDLNVVLGGIVAVYTTARTLIKR